MRAGGLFHHKKPRQAPPTAKYVEDDADWANNPQHSRLTAQTEAASPSDTSIKLTALTAVTNHTHDTRASSGVQPVIRQYMPGCPRRNPATVAMPAMAN